MVLDTVTNFLPSLTAGATNWSFTSTEIKRELQPFKGGSFGAAEPPRFEVENGGTAASPKFRNLDDGAEDVGIAVSTKFEILDEESPNFEVDVVFIGNPSRDETQKKIHTNQEP